LESPNRSVCTLIVFGLMASATFAEGSRPPRLTKLEAKAPASEILLRAASGASGPDDGDIRVALPHLA
jgi:hypothetical protein